MGYSAYTETMFFKQDGCVYPKGGLYEDAPKANSLIEVDKETSRRLAEAEDAPSETLIAVLVPENESGYYWPQTGVTLHRGGAYHTATVRAVAIFKDEEEYARYQENRRLQCTPWLEEYAGRALLLVVPN